ncbi:MAG: hypothetical protein GY950_34965 [bacterium]|nr:hypothetical protein [bacterium]
MSLAVAFVFFAGAEHAKGQQTNRQKVIPKIKPRKFVKRPVLKLLPSIKKIDPFYDDCQLIFYVKGNFFGSTQGNRVIHMKSNTKSYQPQILKWTPTQIDCLLKGNFELGRKYKVSIRDKISHKVLSNEYPWVVKTQIKLKNQGYKPGQTIAFSGCLLGYSQGARKLIIGRSEVPVTQWTCEDIIFKVPNLPPGTYPLYLTEGRLRLSNTIRIKII